MKRQAFIYITSLVLLLSLGTGIAQGGALLQPPLVVEAAQTASETNLPQELADLPGASADWWTAVQEDIRQSEYALTWQEQTHLIDLPAAYQAPNRAQNLRTYFTPAGVRLIPRVYEGDAPPWEWGLTLSGYGSTADVLPVAAAALSTEGNRMEYQRGDLTEWYVNDERGLEQGFTLHAPPASAGKTLILELSLSGDLTPHLSADGSAIEFTTRGGVTVLRYDALAAWDAAGRDLPAQFSLSKGVIRIHIDAADAVYPISVDPLVTPPPGRPRATRPVHPLATRWAPRGT